MTELAPLDARKRLSRLVGDVLALSEEERVAFLQSLEEDLREALPGSESTGEARRRFLEELDRAHWRSREERSELAQLEVERIEEEEGLSSLEILRAARTEFLLAEARVEAEEEAEREVRRLERERHRYWQAHPTQTGGGRV